MSKRILFGSVIFLFVILGAESIDLGSDEDLCSFTQNPALLENGFAVAKIIAQPSTQSDGRASVLFVNGVEGSPDIILSTRKATRNDIELWKWVLWNENFQQPLTEMGYRMGAWYFGVVTSVEEPSQNTSTVNVNNVPIPLDWIRVTEEPVYIDLRGQEVLCAITNEPEMTKNIYAVATIKTPASAKSQNQAEVVYYNNFTGWTFSVLQSHRAEAEELRVGDMVLFNEMFYQPLTESRYRFSRWYIGRITSVQNVFKGIVEVNGVDMSIAWLRLQDAAPVDTAADLSLENAEARLEARAPTAIAVLPGYADDKPSTAKAMTQPPTHEALPSIAKFDADPGTVEAGGRVTLSWHVLRADQVSLDGQTVPAQGQRMIVVNKTQSHILEARSGDLTAQDSLTVYARQGNIIQAKPLDQLNTLIRALPEVSEVMEAVTVRPELQRPPAAETLRDKPVYARVLLDSLYCVSESDWDHGTNSDEPYAIVTGFTTYTEPLSWDTGQPQVFGDVDDGDNRQFTEPQRLVFEGEVPPGESVGFSVVLMEQDGWGNSVQAQIGNKLADETGKYIAEVIGGLAGSVIGGPLLGTAVGSAIGWALAELFEELWDAAAGGGDDKVADEQVVVSYDQLKEWAAEGPHKASILELNGGSNGKFWIRWHIELEEDGSRAFSHRFTPWDGFAAGDLLGSSADEMVIAIDEDAGGDSGRYYIIGPTGRQLNVFDRHFTHNDRIVCGDVMGDNRDEVICASDDSSGTVYIFAANSQELVRFATVFTKYDGLAVGNVTGDEKEEIIVARDQDDDFTVYSGDGRLLRSESVSVDFDGCRYNVDHPDSNRNDGFLVGDVTGDDYADIIFIDKQGDRGQVHVFDFFGRSYRAPFEIYLSEKDGMALGDLDGDGKEEILVATDGADDSFGYAIRIYDVRTGQRTGTRYYPCFTRYDGFACGDVLGTGKDQVLMATDEHNRIGIAK